MKRRILVLILTLFLVLYFGLFTAGAETNEQIQFSKAKSELSLGNYKKAAELFADLGAFEDAPLWAIYSRGMYYTEISNYNEAIKAFTLLDDFQDSQLRLNYVLAALYEYREDYEGARNIYENYRSYLDFDEKLREIPEKIHDRDYRRAERCIRSIYSPWLLQGQLGSSVASPAKAEDCLCRS